MSREQLKAEWRERMLRHVQGKTIVDIRWMSEDEVREMGWSCGAVVLVLDDGTLLLPSRDDEGNGPGALFGQSDSEDGFTFPVI